LYHGPCTYSNSIHATSLPQLDDLLENSSVKSSLPLLKGSFTPLDFRRIALPSDPECMPETWIPFLPYNIRKFLSSVEGGMTNQIHTRIQDIPLSELPRPRVWALEGHYPEIIALSSRAGMISWSSIGSEPPKLRRLRDSLTMSSFGVTKDLSSDRLISWPRVQNELFLPPPIPNFPDPSAFSRIFADQSPDGAGFAMDVANMFHNIRLPVWLVSLFPLTPICYRDMPEYLQNIVRSELQLACHPNPYALFRPLQRTLPMGFTWAAYLGHSIAEGCLNMALEIFCANSTFTYRVLTLSGKLNVVEPKRNDIVIAHIIDDVNVVLYDSPLSESQKLQHIFWRSFTMSGLPIRAAKCTPLNKIQTDALPFIGFTWDLKTGNIFPKDSRTSNLSDSIDGLLECPSSYQEKEVERIVGKLVWTCMARRPLLSVLRSVFRLPPSLPAKRNRNSAARELRTISALLPLAVIDTKRKIWETVLATDASPKSGAVTYAQSDRGSLLSLISTCRYNNGPLSHPACSNFALSHQWETGLTHRWRREEHINILEAESILLAVRWAIEQGARNHRIVLLSDSAVCIGAITKGRSSSSGLLRVCRKLAALFLMHGIELILLPLSTRHNPADGPSRGLPLESRFRTGFSTQDNVISNATSSS